MSKTSNTLLCIATLFVASALCFALSSSFFAGLVLFLLGVGLVFSSKALLRSDTLCLVVTIAYLVGIFFAMLLYWGYTYDYGLPYWLPGQDDYNLEQDAIECIQKNYYTPYDMASGDTYRFQSHNTKGYVVFLAFLMRVGDYLGGYSTLAPRFFNVCALNMIGILMAFYLKHRGGYGDSRLSKLYLAITLFPNMLYVGAHVYRDVFVSLLLFSSFIVATQLESRKRPILCILALIAISYLSYWLRALSVVFVAGIVAIVLLFGKSAAKEVMVRKVLIAAMAIVAAFLIVLYSSDDIVRYVSAYGASIASGDSAFVSGIYGLPLLPIGLPMRLLAYLFSPFYYSTVFNPTVWLDSTAAACQVFVSVGTVFLASRYIYIGKAFKHDRQSALIALFLLVGIALSTSGYRHIVMVYPFMFLALAQGIFCVGEDVAAKRHYSQLSVIFGCLFVAGFCLLFML